MKRCAILFAKTNSLRPIIHDMAKRQKTEEIKVRVTTDMKRAVLSVADSRGEGESLIVREALAEYLAKRTPSKAEPPATD